MEKIGSLFSGIGGIEIGFEKAGFKTEWFVECELYAKAILKKRFPEAKIYDDVTKIDFREVPRVEILTGGFPCQDISNAGKRVGIEGSRSSLWKYYLKAISQIRPRIAFIENVSALLSRGLSVVLCDLAKIGYDAEWYCVPASAVGANHQRDRIFIICYPNNNGQPSTEEREGIETRDGSYSERKKQTSELERSSEQYANVENSISNRMYEGNRQDVNRREKEEQYSDKSICSSSDVSNTNGFRLEEQELQQGLYARKQKISDASNTKSPRWEELWESRKSMYKKENKDGETNRFEHDGIWKSEPNVGRVANGISFRVDRIKCLGNAVVPQLAEIFAKAIKK
jgi:DNA (cytosine-5)-methyltransferase 1